MSGGRPPRVLSIAGTDPTGGAGLQADLKSIAAHDGYGMGVVTALVAQNTSGVRAVHVPDVTFLREQLDAVSDDVEVDAVKIGMLGSAAVVRAVVAWLREHRPPYLVVDPVMVATSGDRLLDEDAEAAMADLIALADLVTPNRAELRVLSMLAGCDDPDPTTAALAVARAWDVAVLTKGGHADGPTADDVLVTPDGGTRTFSVPRVHTSNTHGTGCSLSSAIATLVARHGDWELAVGGAKTWLTAALRGADALRVGTGNGPVDHNALVRAALPSPRWTDTWWEDVGPVLDETVATPFLQTMLDGTLDIDVFAGYLAQDVHYLRAYETHLSSLAAAGAGDAGFWAAAADGCRQEAADLHHRRLAHPLGRVHADDPVHAVCAGYLDHLAGAAADTPAVLAAAVLPCFRVYAWVGERLRARRADVAGGLSARGQAADTWSAGAQAADTRSAGAHPFGDWLDAYGDPAFAASSTRATALVEELADGVEVAERGRMARAFRRSTEWELAFFRMPYALGTGTVSGLGTASGSVVPGASRTSHTDSAEASTSARIHV